MTNFVAAIKRHLFILAIANMAIVSAILAFRKATYSETWTADAKLSLADVNTNLTADLGPLGSLENVSPKFSTQINPLRLQTMIFLSDIVMRKAMLVDPESEEFEKISEYRNLFKVTTAEQAPVIDILVEASTPEIAQERLEIVISTYQDRLNKLRENNSAAVSNFNQDKLSEAQDELRKSQQLLESFQRETGLIDPEAQLQAQISLLESVRNEFISVGSEATALRNKVEVLSNRLGLTPQAAITALSLDQNQGYLQVRAQLVETSIRLDQALSRYTALHPEVSQLEDLKRSLESQIRTYVQESGDSSVFSKNLFATGIEGQEQFIQEMLLGESNAAAKQRQAEQLFQEIREIETDIRKIPEARSKLLELERNYEVADGIFKGLAAQTEQANIDSFNSYPNIQVLDPPNINPVPIKPSLALTIINGMLAILFANVSIIWLLERRNPLLLSKDLKDFQFPLITKVSCPENEVIFDHPQPDFTWLATSLYSSQPPGSCISIVNAEPFESGELVSVKLADALASIGFKVLLIDMNEELCNSLQLLYSTRTGTGLQEPVGLSKNLYFASETTHNLKFDAASIAQGVFEKYLRCQMSSSSYDYVIVSSPPLLKDSRSILVNKVINNVLYVIRPGYSRRSSTMKTLEQLNQQGIEILGIAINIESPAEETFLSNQDNSNTTKKEFKIGKLVNSNNHEPKK